MTPKERRLIEAGAAIKAVPAEDLDYVHTVFTSVYLPVRDPGPLKVWDRRSGQHHLRIEAGSVWSEAKAQYVELGLPFGARGRLVMIYLTSQAVKTNSPEIEVGDSLRAFVRRLGIGTDGKAVGGVKEQLRRLSVAVIRMAHVVEGRTRQVNAQIVEGMDMWATSDPRQRMLWQDTVLLSERFFRSVRDHAVPLDDRAVAELSNNPTALDVYAWLAARLWRVRGVEHVSWRALHEQFGQGTESVRKFRQNFLLTLKRVAVVYDPVRRIEATNTGLLLPNAPPPITPTIRKIKD
jgi:hypothetical protein